MLGRVFKRVVICQESLPFQLLSRLVHSNRRQARGTGTCIRPLLLVYNRFVDDHAAPLLADSLELLFAKLESGIPHSSENGHLSTSVVSCVLVKVYVNAVSIL